MTLTFSFNLLFTIWRFCGRKVLRFLMHIAKKSSIWRQCYSALFKIIQYMEIFLDIPWKGMHLVPMRGWFQGKTAKSIKKIFGHRPFLPCVHIYRWQKKAFNWKQMFKRRVKVWMGEDVFEKIRYLQITFGKGNKKDLPTHGYIECSREG